LKESPLLAVEEMETYPVKRECKECFDRFITYTDADYCKACEAELARRLNEEMAARAAQRKAAIARAAMDRRVRFWASRPPIDFEKLL
jgi:hypothetical protein